MQFGFMPRKGTIFIVRQDQGKVRTKKPACYASVDFQIARNRVLTETITHVLKKAGVEQWLVDTEGQGTLLRNHKRLWKCKMVLVIDWFNVLVGLHQRSALSQLLLFTVMVMLSREVGKGRTQTVVCNERSAYKWWWRWWTIFPPFKRTVVGVITAIHFINRPRQQAAQTKFMFWWSWAAEASYMF